MMIRHVPWFLRQVLTRLTGQARSKSVSVVSASVQCSEPKDSTVVASEKSGESDEPGSGDAHVPDHATRLRRARGRMVAAAFASLSGGDKASRPKTRNKSSVDDQIASADSVDALLTVVELPSLSRHQALRIISVLSDWSVNGRVKLADFEGDVRFVKLCRILGRNVPGAAGLGDLATVLGVTGDDEAAKLVAGISLPQMIKVMSTLAKKRRRSTPLLRSLAFNVARQEERLDMKQCADVLYAASMLNFPDDVLMEKVCADLCECVPVCSKSAAARSVLTSLGLLRYKNPEVLDVLSEWVVTNADSCRPQDLASLVLTLASLNHQPVNADSLFDVLEKHMPSSTLLDPVTWLEFVWALFVLNRGSAQHAETVLSAEFISKLGVREGETGGIGTASKLKLLNINACAQLKLSHYKGPLLAEDSDVYDVPLTRSQEKSLLTAAIFDALSNLFSSSTYLRRDINTGLGFLLDGECLLDANCNPLPVGAADSSASETSGKKMTRIGIVSLGYHDLCRGILGEPNGISTLCIQLLQKKGYKVLIVPHTEFSPHAKLLHKVQYLEQLLKNLVRAS